MWGKNILFFLNLFIDVKVQSKINSRSIKLSIGQLQKKLSQSDGVFAFVYVYYCFVATMRSS